MVRFHKVNGVQIQFTAEEETARDLEEQQWNEGAFDRSMENLRQKRNLLLKETDWVVLPDSPITDKTAWETYRTQLRDITNGLTTVEQVNAVVFPTKPN